MKEPFGTWYRLDEQNNVVECKNFQEFYDWNRSLPQDDRTSVGKYIDQDWIGKTFVSTVFLSTDHGWNNDVPIVFETMVFVDPELSITEEDCDRYATYAEAVAGHQKMLEKWKAKLEVPQ